MLTKPISRRMTPEGDLALVKSRDPKLLTRLREGQKLSQRQAAIKLDISHGHLADIERGTRQPSYKVAERFAGLYGLSIDALFSEIPLEYGPPDEVAS